MADEQIIRVEAVASMASINTMGSDLPREAAKLIEQAMAAAVRNAMAEGVTDPEEIKAEMLKARESVKLALRQQAQQE